MRSELADAIMGTNIYAHLYDPIGNRQLASVNEVTNLYQANELNQYTNINEGAVVPVYDADGNMTSYGSWQFTWDAENRLISVSSNGVPVVQNQYDYMSRRVMKATATQTNTFLYDGWNLIRENIGAATTSSRSYVWGLDLSGTLQGAGGVGGLLCWIEGRDGSPSRPFFPSYDANGNITDLVDTNGTVVAHYEYDPYGNTIAKSGDQADTNPFRFSSKYRDGETGFYYYGYRYYNPELGRWLSRDPIGEMGGANIYVFVANCPLCFIDPHGLAACSWAVGLCSRNVAGVDVPRSVTIRGRTYTIPNWVRNAVNRVVPDHHDVRVESYSSTDCTGAAEDTLTRGFFADSFNDAISHYAVSLIPFTREDGWVSGHVGNSSDPGPCSMTCVGKDRYDTVKQRISSSTASRYHLTRYNCQTWAAEQLR